MNENMTIDTSGSWLDAIANWAISLMDAIGAPGAALAVALENLFPPLPSEVILPMAGFAASHGSFTFFEALLWTTIGSVVGAFALYWLGTLLGLEHLRAIAKRLPLVKVSDVDKTVAWFHKHGSKAVFFGRMVPIFRSLISIPAGVTHMPPIRFGLLTFAGSLIWNGIFVSAGYFLGQNWHVVEAYASIFQNIVIVVVVLGVGAFVLSRIHAKVTKKHSQS